MGFFLNTRIFFFALVNQALRTNLLTQIHPVNVLHFMVKLTLSLFFLFEIFFVVYLEKKEIKNFMEIQSEALYL